MSIGRASRFFERIARSGTAAAGALSSRAWVGGGHAWAETAAGVPFRPARWRRGRRVGRDGRWGAVSSRGRWAAGTRGQRWLRWPRRHVGPRRARGRVAVWPPEGATEPARAAIRRLAGFRLRHVGPVRALFSTGAPRSRHPVGAGGWLAACWCCQSTFVDRARSGSSRLPVVGSQPRRGESAGAREVSRARAGRRGAGTPPRRGHTAAARAHRRGAGRPPRRGHTAAARAVRRGVCGSGDSGASAAQALAQPRLGREPGLHRAFGA